MFCRGWLKVLPRMTQGFAPDNSRFCPGFAPDDSRATRATTIQKQVNPPRPPRAIRVRAQFGDVWAPPKNCYFARNLGGKPTWTPPRAIRVRAQFDDVWALPKNRYFARNLGGKPIWTPPPGNTCALAIWWCLGTSQKLLLCKEFRG